MLFILFFIIRFTTLFYWIYDIILFTILHFFTVPVVTTFAAEAADDDVSPYLRFSTILICRQEMFTTGCSSLMSPSTCHSLTDDLLPPPPPKWWFMDTFLLYHDFISRQNYYYNLILLFFCNCITSPLDGVGTYYMTSNFQDKTIFNRTHGSPVI